MVQNNTVNQEKCRSMKVSQEKCLITRLAQKSVALCRQSVAGWIPENMCMWVLW